LTNLTKNLKIYYGQISGGNWGEWSGFSDCSVTCGECLKSRKRKCSSKINDFLEVAPCVGKEIETESSQLKPCLYSRKFRHVRLESNRSATEFKINSMEVQHSI
jgi:hypothetical protein